MTHPRGHSKCGVRGSHCHLLKTLSRARSEIGDRRSEILVFALVGLGKISRYRPLKVVWRYQLSGIRSVTHLEHTRQKDDWGSQAQVTQTQQRTVSEPRSHKFVRLLWITHLSGSYLELSLTEIVVQSDTAGSCVVASRRT